MSFGQAQNRFYQFLIWRAVEGKTITSQCTSTMPSGANRCGTMQRARAMAALRALVPARPRLGLRPPPGVIKKHEQDRGRSRPEAAR